MPESDRRRDEELVAAYLRGERDAFGTLMKRHERQIYNLAYRMLGREQDAEEAVQEVSLLCLRKVSSFRGESTFATWLHRVTVNVCYDALRHRRRAREHELPADVEELPVADHAEASAGAVDVERALARVPPEFRATLILHDVLDLPYEEVARVVGVPVGTVKSRIHRGRVMLARALSGREETLHPPAGSPAPSGGAEPRPHQRASQQARRS